MKTNTFSSSRWREHLARLRFTPIRNLTPELLSRQLDAFHAGDLRAAALTWEAIERRDDVVQSVAAKRKAAAARHGWEILTTEDSPTARRHQEALTAFYRNLTAINALDENERGGFALLVRQMLDAVGKRYAVHEIVWKPLADGHLTAEFRFVPLWFFENRTGRLRFLETEHTQEGRPLEENGWMITVGPGVMEACSVAYLFKTLPLRDWLVYCERNGMPGIKGTTDAPPGSHEWEAAREAVENFGAEFHALMGRGTELEAIHLESSGALPYPDLVERMDRAMVVLWRGADLGTLSRGAGVGASLQQEESDLLAEGDAQLVSEVLQTQVNRPLLRHLFGEEPRAVIEVRAGRTTQPERDLQVYRLAWEMGIPLSEHDFRERFHLAEPSADAAIIQSK